MGGNATKHTRVSFGLDEEQNVTIIKGVKLSGNVLHRMQDSEGSSDSVKSPAPKAEDPKPAQDPKPGPANSEELQDLRKRFEREQALVQEQLTRLAQREKEVMVVGPPALQDVIPAVLRERAKTQEQLDMTKQLAKQLEKKEAELQSLSAFYKEQLLLLEKKSLDHYKQTSEQYNQAATKAEDHIHPRHTASVCPELQAQVFQCYRKNSQQTLHCSGLAKDYLQCIHAAKKNLLINHG